MSELCKKERGNVRQVSTNQLVPEGGRDWLLYNNLRLTRLEAARSAISDFKKQNHSWPPQQCS